MASGPQKRIALATCVKMPEPDLDEPLLERALREVGFSPSTVGWNREDVDWKTFDMVVVRSTWDYHHSPGGFVEWLEAVERHTRLYNPAAVIRDNVHKGYLTELPERGIRTIPTRVLKQGTPFDPRVLEGLDEVVLKPATSAGSFLTARFRTDDADAISSHAAAILSSRDLLVQPYMPSVEDPGERSAVWIDGAFTHVIRKSPRFGDDEESVVLDKPLTDSESRIATQALRPWANELLYARVDLIKDEAGEPLVAELELIEPSLFLSHSEAALDRLVTGIARRLG